MAHLDRSEIIHTLQSAATVVFILCLMLAVAALANPLRYFEVYLGQWSISGPGRAFRIIPMLDGIGVAICINAIVRAITCCAIAAIAAIYVIHSVSDAELPFTYCRDFELRPYEPDLKSLKAILFPKDTIMLEVSKFKDDEELMSSDPSIDLHPYAWRNISLASDSEHMNKIKPDEALRTHSQQIAICKETFSDGYPPLYSTPAYNFFFVEVVQFHSDNSFRSFNKTLLVSLGFVWVIIWLLMIVERLRYTKLIWNNIYSWIVIIPWIWVTILAITASCNLALLNKPLRQLFQLGAKEVFAAIGDAFEIAMYIHSVSVGTTIINGKGLNHFASGHIDPHLHKEMLLHSGLVLLLSVLHSTSAALCAVVDYIHPKFDASSNAHESTLWIIPMYSKCTTISGYSHLISALIFGGLMFSYITVAFLLLKSALHTIFEYKVKLVFVEQVIVAALILTCMGFSLLFATKRGIALLESVDAVMNGLAMSFICLLEVCAMLYVYRSRDFISDINVANEENTCASRITIQWHIIPCLTIITIIIKCVMLSGAEMPSTCMYIALVPLMGVLLAVPLRACHNAYVYLRPASGRSA